MPCCLLKIFFSEFTSKQIVDTSTFVEAILAISTNSREEVDLIVDRALASGLNNIPTPIQQPNIYSRNFADLDGHLWEYFWMDPNMVINANTPTENSKM